ncbi:YceI family protein [Actinophytocola sp.]|uniref:YceI family protein n=1 Tax=Actinophytocola sp. TaxID=1872138 RepID=UPI002ED54390
MTTIEAPTTGRYRIEPSETTISFATRHFFGLAPVRGTFALREGVVHVAEPVAASMVRVTVDARRFDTGHTVRDDNVRSPRFLDAARCPDITFVANGVADGQVARGTLTVRGRTEPLDVRIDEVRAFGDRLHIRASAEVDRYAWGITAMKGMTGRRLRFTLSAVATRDLGEA